MISVIMPVYNSENFLAEAIDSVCSQSFTDRELILVDDGSTDSSGKMCNNYALHHEFIRVIHKSNGGLSSARNAGLDVARGDFIFFLDADDILSPDALEKLMDTVQSENSDIICGTHIKFEEGSLPDIKADTLYPSSPEIINFTPKEAVKEVLYQKSIDNSAWGKLYRRSLWEDLRFRENTNYEDLDIFYKLFLKANQITSISYPLLFYRQHSSSYLHVFNLKRRDMLDVTRRLEEYIGKECPELSSAARSRRLSANFNMFMLIASNRNRGKIDSSSLKMAENIERECWEKIKELRAEALSDRNVRLKNKVGVMASYLGGSRLMRFLSRFFY